MDISFRVVRGRAKNAFIVVGIFVLCMFMFGVQQAWADDAALTNGTAQSQESVMAPTLKKGKIAVAKSYRAGRVYVKAKKVKAAIGYEFAVARNKSMTKKRVVVRAKKPEKTISSLKRGKRYFVRARAYAKDSNGNRVYGSWSPAKSVTVAKSNPMKTWTPKKESWYTSGSKNKVTISGNRLIVKGKVDWSRYVKNAFKLNGKSYLGYLADDLSMAYSDSMRLSRSEFAKRASKRGWNASIIVKNGYVVEARLSDY